MAMAQDSSTTSVLLEECQRYQAQVLDLQRQLEEDRISRQEEEARAQHETDELHFVNQQWKAKYTALLVQTDEQRRLLQIRIETALQNRAAPKAAVLNLPSAIQTVESELPSALTALTQGDHQHYIPSRDWAELDHARVERIDQALQDSEARNRELKKELALKDSAVAQRDALIAQLQTQLGQWLLAPENKRSVESRHQAFEDQFMYLQQRNIQLEENLNSVQQELQTAQANLQSVEQQASQDLAGLEDRNAAMYDKLVHLQNLIGQLEDVRLPETVDTPQAPEPPAEPTSPIQPETAPAPTLGDSQLLQQLSQQLGEAIQDRDNLRNLYGQVVRELQALRRQIRANQTGSPGLSPSAPPAIPRATTFHSTQPEAKAPSNGPTHDLEVLRTDLENLLKYARTLADPSADHATSTFCLAPETRAVADELQRVGQSVAAPDAPSSAPTTAELERLRGELASLNKQYETQLRDKHRLEKAYLELDARLRASQAQLRQVEIDANTARTQPAEASATPPPPSDEGRKLAGDFEELLDKYHQLTREHEKLDVGLKVAIQDVDRLQ
ncbi:hypothetical protein IWQ60_005680 [Tieghemiomyces parasiticus]|uniref:Uncharacterized protein n=1 Tax=Tieghemiomyces parasiticus TaxID=78921 RepID=A0A9W8DY92_9FUNG|nr:hypothetical protein IWQ60_005680 [Tieghemiomyces parasiticus]